MGTYVGSCLGLGGAFSYSAVAALLDANKKVIYARDERGALLGRQLVAIDKDGRLVCFSVYPISANAAVRLLFRNYDQEFARALGVPVFVAASDDDTYEIETVLAKEWWDDMAWDFESED